ncbi:hypothetical protein EJ04DRAFT_466552 [Polyplosphaeria fusca]|uniref:DNA (cytosine-5)-methyltransferase 1 replication foci domain-containing protein n=1 Tax=Polyplosphaeria fusca TaxID=682080 RepID=A0A9P4V2S6_9PLEO|nr:hypothetical protein EJ04DRAFT_466552 [Polyplosphaeria fusca]
MPVNESQVLKPINPTITNSDDYEIFSLRDARVVHSGNGKLANLLDAYADKPLRVEGKLGPPDKSQQRCLLKKPFKPVDLEITNVMRYSYGQTPDGDVVIWALGKAGWFELEPSRAYNNLYKDMVEAVQILYFITDIYNEPRKRGGGPTAQLIFQEYAEDERFECDGSEEAMKIFYKHRQTFFMWFLTQASGIAWSNTPICQHFKRQFPKEFEAAKARVEGKAKLPRATTSDAPATGIKKSTARGQRKQKEESANVAPPKDDNWWEATAMFDFMQKAMNHRAMRVGHVTIAKVSELMCKRYEIEDVETAKSAILVHADNLLYLMDRPRRKKVQDFANEPIHHELSEGHGLSAAEVRRAQAVELRPRKDHATLKAEASEDSDSESSVATPQRRPRSGKGRLSLLRPRSSKYSGKGKSSTKGKGKARGKQPLPEVSGSDENEEGSSAGSDSQIDTPTQAFSPKRKYTQGVDDVVPRKRAATSSPDPDSPPTTPEEEDDESIQLLPLRWRNGNATAKSSSTLLPPLISTSLPPLTANGPKDSWVCNFDGCNHKTYGASTELGQNIIKEHLEDHERGRANEIGLLMREEKQLRLPVNHLIKRIREMAELQQPLFPAMNGGSSAQLTPIERSE